MLCGSCPAQGTGQLCGRVSDPPSLLHSHVSCFPVLSVGKGGDRREQQVSSTLGFHKPTQDFSAKWRPVGLKAPSLETSKPSFATPSNYPCLILGNYLNLKENRLTLWLPNSSKVFVYALGFFIPSKMEAFRIQTPITDGPLLPAVNTALSI